MNTDVHDLWTIHEVATQLRVDDTTVRRWVKNGVLDAVVLPHTGRRQGYRIKRETVEHLINTPAMSSQRS